MSELFPGRDIDLVAFYRIEKIDEKVSPSFPKGIWDHFGFGGGRFALGHVSKDGGENVLLIVDTNDGTLRTFDLVLPPAWRSVFKDGRLIEEKLMEETKGVVSQAPKETPQEFFSEILKKVKGFPKPFTSGVLLGKEKSRTARFGSAGSPVEIIIEDGRITFKFGGLNLDALKEIGRQVNNLNVKGLASCFQADPNIPGRLALEVTLDGKVKGEIKKWEITRRSLICPSLHFDSEREKALTTLINDKETLSDFLTQLKKPDINIQTQVYKLDSSRNRERPLTKEELRIIKAANEARAVDAALGRMKRANQEGEPVISHIRTGSEQDKERYRREKNQHKKRRK